MTPAEMKDACNASLTGARELGLEESQANVTLVLPKGFKAPPRFPRGYLLQVNDNGSRLRSFPATKLLSWIKWAEAQV
ncbi:hypothetical protein RGK87_04560 [Agrobacterium fabacearum]|uniref:hypothetical protein n=1 Tax=Agrobacterium tumefaciens TaxID=358 RepID=UPI002852FBE1|nr:hypothetical protein [Agrobacterium tumefaciens]MDR5008280.1 hypothetical protein [Agrobacterium tumefaciens]